MKFVLAFAFATLAAFQGLAQTAAVVVSPSTDPVVVRAEAFDQVWKTVNEKHYDPTFGGVDWKKVRTVYEPQARVPGLSDKEFHDVLRRMLGELKLSHFGIHPPAAEMVAAQTGRGVTGIDVLMLDGVPVINRVDADSSAAKAGVKTGQVVTRIDGRPWKDIVAQLEASLAARKVTAGMRFVYLERTLESAINSKPGTTLALDVLNSGDEPQTFSIVRAPFTGEMSQALGNFPPQEVVFESRLLPADIGYIRFNMWVIPQMAKLRKAVADFASEKAIVIDLRGNPGGVGGMAPGLAGLLFKEKASLGSMKTRGGSMEFVAFPQPNPFTGKIILLTDHGTGSTSEVFAAGMQETGRATVIGETTAGAVLPSVFEKLPTGYLFQYAISDYRSPKNILIEGRGVIPDLEVRQTRASLLAGSDAQMAAALKFIQTPAAAAAAAIK
jgi:carboxyl-terminal processing protease